MVFMGDGGAEQRHDAVAHDLVDRPLVAVHRCHHAFQHGIEELPGLLGITVSQQFHRALQVRKQHRDLLALAFQGTAGEQDLLREIHGRVGEGCLLDGPRQRCDSCGRGARVTGPDEASPRIVAYFGVGIEEFGLHIFQGRVIELKLPLEGAVGQASATLEHGKRLVENVLKGHRSPSLCRCGVQKTVWEWNRLFRRIYLYRTWLTKESNKYWACMTQT